MSDLAREMAVSERTLLRRFGAAIGLTPLGYLQAVRLEAARALLEIGDLTVQSVASQVGYSDASSFSRLFRQGVGSQSWSLSSSLPFACPAAEQARCAGVEFGCPSFAQTSH